MYIAYETAQYSTKDTYSYAKRPHPPKKIPNVVPKPEFMPSKLVRISDMAVVKGSQVDEGYCALSYSWNQSGEIIFSKDADEKAKRIDQGKHEIISYDHMFPDMIIPRYIAHKDSRERPGTKLRKIYQVLQIMDENNYHFTKTIKYVKFEGIIQKICQQFNIKYIWFDQVCIDQDNKEERKREIRNMHRIYSNAYCTVALLPEHKKDDFFLDGKEEYFKRLWTLEEAIKSERLLFVKKNKHAWGPEAVSFSSHILTKPVSTLTLAQVLYHAHQRTSTKKHDRVFALINLYPDILQYIDIDYSQPLEDLMIRFYGHLAKRDISILFFRKKYIDYNSTIENYKFLPSWTGVHGEHVFSDATTSTFQNYNVIGKTMYVTSEFVTYGQSIDYESLIIRKEDLPPPPDCIDKRNNKYSYCLCIFVQLSGSSEARMVRVAEYKAYDDIFVQEKHFDQISKELQQLARFMEIKKENLCWCHYRSDDYEIAIRFNFTDLIDDTDELFAQYMILTDVSFKRDNNYFQYYLVIKKGQRDVYYRTIGCCEVYNREDFFSDCKLPTKTFLIQ